MQIPYVNSGFGGVRPSGAPVVRAPGVSVPGVSVPGISAPSGAYDVSSGMKDVAQVGMNVADDMIRQQNEQIRKQTELARAKSANAILDHEIAVKTLTEDLHAKIQTGQVPYGEGKQAFADAIGKLPPPEVPNADPVTQEHLQTGVKRLNAGGEVAIGKSVEAAQRSDFKGQWGQVLDKLGKLGGMPGADIEKINAQAEAFTTLAHQAGLQPADVAKQLQDFKDQNWTNHATQAAMEARNDLPALQDISKQLTSADGYYANKLDTTKRNVILSQITNQIIRLENKNSTLVDKAEAVAEKATDRFEADIMTGIPVTPNRVTQDLAAVKGTSSEQRFMDAVNLSVDVQKIMAKPPTEQAAILNSMRTQLATKGADFPAREKKLLDTLTAAHDSFVKTLTDEPLKAVSLRTGQDFVPLTPAALADPKQIPAIMKDREAWVAAAAKQYGPEVKPKLLLASEADMIKKAMEPMTAGDQRTFLGTMKATMSGDAFRHTMDQIGADNVMKLAGVAESYKYQTTENRAVSQILLEGRKLLADKTTIMPKERSSGGDALAPAFTQYVGDAIPRGTKANEMAYQGVQAVYAVLSKEAGKNDGVLDTEILKRSIRWVTGGIVDYNGTKVIPPYGMDESTFTDKAKIQIDGLKDKSAMSPDELRRLPLERTPDGYAFRNGRSYIPGKDGKPLTIKVAP